MKNFTKIALIVSLALVILGSLCCAVSLGIGFSFDDFWSDVKDGAYSFGPIGDVGDAIWSNRFNWKDDGEDWNSASGEDFTFQWQGEDEKNIVDKLDLKVYYGTVKIVENHGNANDIQVTVEYRKKNHRRKVEAYKDGTTLRIEETGSKRSRNNDSTRITIRLPRELAEEDKALQGIFLQQDAGDIYVDMPLVAKQIGVTVNAGECLFYSRLRALEECKADVDVGQIDLEEVEAPRVTLKSNVGQIDTEEITADDIFIDCGIGAIDAEVSGREQDYNYEISCGVGEVSIGDNDYSGLGARKKIDNSADKTIQVNCGVGEVELYFEED